MNIRGEEKGTNTFSTREDTMKILFSDEELLDIDGICNCRNDRTWTVSRVEADRSGGVKQKRNFSQKVMIWLTVFQGSVANRHF